MSATLTVDPKKYTRLANRPVVKAIETEEEYDHRSLPFWKPRRSWPRLTIIVITLCLRLRPT